MKTILFKKLRRDLWARKGSLLALIVIVMIGIGTYVSYNGVYHDLENSRILYFKDYQLADFSVDLKRAPEWAVNIAGSLPNVSAIRGRVNLPVLLEIEGVDVPISGTAISMPLDNSPVMNDVLLRTGTWFSGINENEVILNEAFARANNLQPGSRIKALMVDKQHDLLVIGTAMSPEFIYLMSAGSGLAPDPARFGVMYLSKEFLQKSADLEGAYNQIIGMVYNDSKTGIDNTLTLIEEKLDSFGVLNTSAVNDIPSVRFLIDELKGIEISAKIIPVIFMFVAVLILNVIMSRIVAQQRSIIGTLRAIGYSSRSVIFHYIAYGAVIGTVGGIAGLFFGWWMQNLYVVAYRKVFALPSINAHFYPNIYLTGLLVSIVFSILGTIKGAKAAAGTEPAIAMRPPTPERGGRIIFERIPFIWNRLSFQWKMILRTIFRNPFRSMVNIVASIVATALIIVSFSMMDAMNYLTSYEFEKVSHQDITIALRDPSGFGTISEVNDFPDISITEPQLNVVCDVSNGPYKKRVGFIGLAPGNILCTPLDGNGKPIVVPDAGLVLTKKLAEILNVQPGDNLRLRPLIGQRQEVSVPVVSTVDSFLGLSAYANINFLSGLIGEEWSANTVLGGLYKGNSDKQFLDELRKYPSVVGLSERKRALKQLDEAFGESMGIMISIMVLIAGIIAFGAIFNAALVSLSERQREVGTFRVIGYTPTQVTNIFSGESFLLNTIGIILGWFTGIWLSHLISNAYSTEIYRFPAIIYPSKIVLTSILMLIFISLAQLIIYRMIKKFEWLEVLKVKE